MPSPKFALYYALLINKDEEISLTKSDNISINNTDFFFLVQINNLLQICFLISWLIHITMPGNAQKTYPHNTHQRLVKTLSSKEIYTPYH